MKVTLFSRAKSLIAVVKRKQELAKAFNFVWWGRPSHLTYKVVKKRR